ncbi:MAG TPA: type II secretion system protein GspD [Sulfurospirillum arcachonense]|nr:type II secretion system protein GspD [Sulfurospirillum arcachonense]
MRLISILVIFASLIFANQEKIEINFKDLKIDEFVKMVSKISDKNILLTSSIPGKVNFISIKPIDKSQIYDLLISVLKNKGYTLIDSKSGYLQIVRSSDAVRESPPFRGESKLNQIQTDIIGIKNLSATQMLTQVNFLLSKYGKIAVSKEANSLVITDYPKNLKSIRGLLNKLDSQKSMDIEFYTLINSKVTSVLPKIKNIATSVYNQKMPSQKISLFADEGTNTLIIISKKKIIKELLLHVKQLDKKDEVSQRSLHIVHLKNSDAQALAKTLQTIISNKPVSKDKKVKVDSQKPTFTADEETNILMIYASGDEMKEIEILIKALDVPRQQVYVVAKIAEINDRKSREIGAKYGIAGGLSNSSGLFTFSSNLGGPPVAIDLQGLGLSMSSVTQAIALGATISFLETNDAANILSQPSLLCVNNIESSIYVGETQSIITQGNTAADSTTIEKNNYTREDIGLTLKVKPRISSDKKVLLDVKVTIEGVKETLKIGLPTTTKRDISTTAIVKNGESIIIGGLTQEIIKDNSSQIPLLGDIPWLGQLFRYDDENNDKKSLVIILTPYIVDQKLGLSSLKSTLAKLNKLEQDFSKRIGNKKDVN